MLAPVRLEHLGDEPAKPLPRQPIPDDGGEPGVVGRLALHADERRLVLRLARRKVARRVREPSELAPQPAAERRCKIEAARPLRATCPAGARMVP